MAHSHSIKDTDLIMKLVNSRIDERQQRELELLIPDMDDKDRQELMHLIHRANAEPSAKGRSASGRKKNSVLKKVLMIAGTLLIVAGAILILITYGM